MAVVDCGKPSDIKNGKTELTSKSTKWKSLVSYSCDKGYVLKGSSFQKCLADGETAVKS